MITIYNNQIYININIDKIILTLMNKNRESKDNLMKKVKMNKLDIPSSNLIIDKGKKPRHNQHLTQ